MRRKIPATTALVGFEAAARHQSFTKAAEELALTQSAICRQIANLEDFLGVKLFRRTRRGVQLTEAGRTYSRRVTARLDDLARHSGGDGSARPGRPQPVVPTFATRWLLPRCAASTPTGHHRESDQPYPPFLFADTEFDAAIYFGDGECTGTCTTALMRAGAGVQPACSRPTAYKRRSSSPSRRCFNRLRAPTPGGMDDSLGLRVARTWPAPAMNRSRCSPRRPCRTWAWR